MATPRILTQEQERNVAVAYLCGVDTGYIRKVWNVSDATTRISIVGRRSLEWQDPLVEFYRQTHIRDRARNAVHLYLNCVTEGQDFPNKDLGGAHEAYVAVRSSIFEPRTKGLIRETGLEEILATPVKLTPEERLLIAIFYENAYWRAVSIVEPRLHAKLHEAYFNPQRIKLDSIYDEIKGEIYALLHQGLLLVKNEKDANANKAALEQSFRILSPTDIEFIKRLFGIGCGPSSIEQLSQENGVGRDWVKRQKKRILGKMGSIQEDRVLRYFV